MKAIPVCAGRALSNRLNASRPPAEAPATAMGNPADAAARAGDAGEDRSLQGAWRAPAEPRPPVLLAILSTLAMNLTGTRI